MSCMEDQAHRCRRGRRPSRPALGLLLCALGVPGTVGGVSAQERRPIPAPISASMPALDSAAIPSTRPPLESAAMWAPSPAVAVPMPVPLPGWVETGSYPAFRTPREVALVSLGSSALLAGALTPLDPPAIPAGGLDPAKIRWSLDRESVRPADPAAMAWSDVTDAAALLLPLAVAGTRGSGGNRWEHLARTAALQAEVLLVAQGSVLLAKRLVARPRPCTYLPEATRSPEGHCDLSRKRTFQSLPSGHASSAWSMAGLALTEQLLSRPDAEWQEHAGVGALGGLLATATSGLRVTAGEHFPSDVLLGSGIGILTGVTLPLLHRGERPWPSWTAVLQGAGGMMVGSMAGALVVQFF